MGKEISNSEVAASENSKFSAANALADRVKGLHQKITYEKNTPELQDRADAENKKLDELKAAVEYYEGLEPDVMTPYLTCQYDDPRKIFGGLARAKAEEITGKKIPENYKK